MTHRGPLIDPLGFETEDHGPDWLHFLLVRGTGLVTWLVLLAPIWGALWLPAFWAIAFAGFCIYWLVESLGIALRGVWSERLLRRGMAVDWKAKAEALAGSSEVQHLIVLPTYREPYEVLAESLEAILEQDVPAERMWIVIAAEERDTAAPPVLARLHEQFGNRFGRLLTTIHPDRPGELPGKASNVNWAVRHAAVEMLEAGIEARNILISICDADSRLHPAYLSALTYHFLQPETGGLRLYQPFHLLHGNLERVPRVMRLVAAMYSIIQVARVVRHYRYVQSTYSLPLTLAVRMGFWDVDVIPEDSHTTFKARFRAGKRSQMVPIPLPVWGDVAEGVTIWHAFANHYRQVRRWAWGAYDVPYAIYQSFRARPGERLDAFIHTWLFGSEHLLWPTHWFLLTLGLVLIQRPPGGTTEAFIIDTAALLGSLALGCCWPSFLVLIWLDSRLRRLRTPTAPGPGIAWPLLPLLGLPFFSLPAVDAHTRLLLVGKLSYQVTPKRLRDHAAADAERSGVRRTVPTTDR